MMAGVPSPRILIAALALTLVVGACSSDDEVDTSATTESATADTSGGAPGGEMSLDECVDALVTIIGDTDFDDEASVADISTQAEALAEPCGVYDGDEVQAALEERRDEMSDAAQEYVFGPEVADAAGLPCVEPVEDLGVDTTGAELPTGEPPTELVVTDLVEGDGAEVTEGATVSVDYVGYSCSTGTVFDSSYARGEPAEFGLAQVIPGWSDGLVGMKVGGKRLLVIPSDQGYGPSGSPPDIAGNETLVFVVELRDVVG